MKLLMSIGVLQIRNQQWIRTPWKLARMVAVETARVRVRWLLIGYSDNFQTTQQTSNLSVALSSISLTSNGRLEDMLLLYAQYLPLKRRMLPPIPMH